MRKTKEQRLAAKAEKREERKAAKSFDNLIKRAAKLDALVSVETIKTVQL